jgi:hypothetical protein
MSHYYERIRDMKQQQTSGNRIESFVGPPRVDVTLLERDVGHSRILRSLTRHRNHLGGAIDSHNAAGRCHKFSGHHRHVAETRAEIEDPHPGRQTGGLQQEARGALDHRRLAIETRDLLGMSAERVLLLQSNLVVHDCSYGS